MPQGQLQKVISAELGPDWRSKMASFEDEPLAAASIGQVHSCWFFPCCCCQESDDDRWSLLVITSVAACQCTDLSAVEVW